MQIDRFKSLTLFNFLSHLSNAHDSQLPIGFTFTLCELSCETTHYNFGYIGNSGVYNSLNMNYLHIMVNFTSLNKNCCRISIIVSQSVYYVFWEYQKRLPILT